MSGSYFALNSKINNLQAEINAIIIPSPPLPPTADIVTTNTAQTISAVKTFSVLPQSSVVPTLGDQLVNKTYADATADNTTLQQVLTAGDTAQAPLNITLNDTPNNTFSILSSATLEMDFDDGITPNNAIYQSDGIYHSGDSLSLNTNGVIGFASDNLFANSATLGLTSYIDGYTTNPNLTINATSATAGTTSGVPSVQYYKSGRNGANNDIIGSQQFFAKNSTGVKTEFAKIETLIRNVGVGNDDGSIGIFATLNGVSTEFLRINGADGDNNFLKPLDMNGSAINSSSGNMSISASSSTGTGQITISPKTGSNLTIATTPAGVNRTIINPDGTGVAMTNTTSTFVSTIQYINNALLSTYLFLQQDFGGVLQKNIYLLCSSTTGNTLESRDRHTQQFPFKIKVDNSSFSNSNSSLEIDMNPSNDLNVLAQLTFTNDNTLPATSYVSTAYIPVLIAGTQYYIPITTSPI